MSDSVTTNYGLVKPDFNVRPWDQKVNGNFDLIDSLIYTLFQIPNIVGTWANSTQYQVGQNVFDPQNLAFYTCLVANVSAASGTFAQDRTANPANWTLTQPQLGAIRYDQGQPLTDGQILQAVNNLALFTRFLRFDAGQTLTYTQQLQVLNNLLIDGTEATIASADTTDVGNAGAQNVVITGTTTINSFGTRPNKYKLLRFTGALLLKNSANLVLPGGQDISVTASSSAIVTSDANGVWYVRAFLSGDSNFGAGIVRNDGTVGSVSGTIAAATSSVRYVKQGKIVTFTASISITTNGSGAGGVTLTLPFFAAASTMVTGREDAVTGAGLIGRLDPSSNKLTIYTYNNQYPGGSGYTLILSGAVEVQ